jgi:diguanylate cyclase (GGDEF)-like protein/PAS domain S-box-containing protein
MSTIEPHDELNDTTLQQTKNRLHALISAIPDLIWLKNIDGIYLNANKAFEDFFNTPIDRILGKSDYDFFSAEAADICKISDIEAINATGVILTEENVQDTKNGSKIVLEVRKIAVHDEKGSVQGILGIGRDITEQKQSAEHLQRTKAKLTAVISTIPDLIWVKDAEGVYMLCNSAFERFFGAECGEILGKTDYDFISREQADFFRQKDREAMEAGEIRINEEEIVFAADGRRALLETRKIAVYSGNEFMGVMGIGRDITESRRAEREIIESSQFIQSILNALPDLLFEIDIEGTYINVWTNDMELLAAQKDLLLGRKIGEILDETNAAICLDAIQIADKKGKSIGHQICIDLPSGCKWFELSVSKISAPGDRFLTLSRDITERKQYEIELAISNEKFRTITENTRDTIARYDRECRRTYANNAFIALSGKSLDELLGVKPTYYYDSPQSRLYEEALQRVFGSGVAEVFEYLWPDKSGNMITSHIHIVPEKDEVGNIYSVLATGRDITKQKILENAIQANNILLHSILESSPEIVIFGLDRNYRYSTFNSKHSEIMFSIWGKKIEIGHTIFDYISDPTDAKKAKQNFDRALHGESFNTEEIYGSELHSRRYWQIFYAPIYDQNREVTGLTCFNLDITDQRKSDWLLHTLSSALNVSSESVFLINLHTGRFVYVNDTASNQLGYTKEELTSGMSVLDIDPNFNPEQWDEHINDLQTLRNVTIETTHRTKEGHLYPAEVVAHYFEHEGHRYNLAVTRDITQKKEYENTLLAREREYRTLTENSPDVIIRYNLSGERIYINPMGEKLFGRSATEILGKKATEISPIPVETAFMDKFIEVTRTKNSIETETEFTNPTGEKGWGHMRIVPEFDAEGNVISILTIGRDITERKRNEEQLKYKEERLREAQQIAKIGSWEIEFPGLKLTWSDEIFRIFEINPQTSHPSYDHFLNAIHPDDRTYVDQTYSEALEKKIPYDAVHRLLMSDGRVKYVHERAITIYDEEDIPIRTVGTVQDITEQKKTEKKIQHMALHDALTGLPNRVLAKERMENTIRYAQENGTKTALLFIDLDGFKTINDTLGHSVGDSILKQVANRLKECIRSLDTLCRLGGDEFLLILSGIESNQDIVVIVEKVLEEFTSPINVLHHNLPVSMSIGIALYPDHGEHFESLLQKSDTAMYKAKDAGKNTYCFYSEQMKHILIAEFKLQNDLRQALRENQFLLHYQPQIDLATKRIVGVEALIRWSHPQLGMIPPMQFISIAENNGLIVPIGEWVIHEACRQLALWKEQGIRTSIAINISAIQFKRGNLVEIVEKALQESGIEPSCLEFELTESIMMHDTEKTLEVVRQLKNLGLQLSIDDFGTGYSSLAYLKRFTVDKLKIDQSFVRDIVSDPEDAIIVSTIIQMAKSLNLKTIAEGVENQAVLEIIESFECDEVQGYHYSKPIEASAFEAFYHAF